MKKYVTKKNVLYVSSVYLVYFLALFLLDFGCDSSWCRIHDDDFFGVTLYSLAPLFPVFIFSLITYRMPKAVFDHWMQFAIWATPLVMFLTYLINGGGNNGLGVEGVIGGAFDMLLLMIIYGSYIGISVWRIVWAYRRK